MLNKNKNKKAKKCNKILSNEVVVVARLIVVVDRHVQRHFVEIVDVRVGQVALVDGEQLVGFDEHHVQDALPELVRSTPDCAQCRLLLLLLLLLLRRTATCRN